MGAKRSGAKRNDASVAARAQSAQALASLRDMPHGSAPPLRGGLPDPSIPAERRLPAPDGYALRPHRRPGHFAPP